MQPTRLRCEYRHNPLGIDVVQPRLSWALESAGRGQVQSAYQILVADSPERLAAGLGNLWDSGVVASSQSVHVAYAGRPLTSGQRCWWQVRVWDQEGMASDYSEPAWWQMGLLEAADWQAFWIGLDTGPAGELGMTPCPYLRRAFRLDRPVRRATLYAAAKGLYLLYLNGRRAGDAALAPEWTEYQKRIVYDTYDVTGLLQVGENVLGAILGDGWFAGYVGWKGGRNHYGRQPWLLAQLEIEHTDGSRTIWVTDGSWRGASGPILYSDLLMGESYDARLEMPGWDQPGFDDSAWRAVQVEARDPRVQLAAQSAEPVRITGQVRPQGLSQPQPGVYVFDLGQNLAGRVELHVQGPAGAQVRLRFAEVLQPDGMIYTASLRSARATDTYTLRGGAPEVFEPHFTYHGFRYVEVTGYPGAPSLESILGRVLHSDLALAGRFECSSPAVNQLWRNILWSQRSNLVSIPTDCPQRDERLGWLGDVVCFGRTACFNMDMAAFLTRWAVTLEDAQSPEGGFPDVAPRLVTVDDGAPGWGDAGVIVPWLVYQVYGDTRILARHYAAMERWMRYLHEANPSLLRTARLNRNYGDWHSYHADTPREVLATAYWAYDAHLMAQIAQVLGREEDANRYERLCQGIKQAFRDAFVSADGRIQGETQTVYVLALYMDLLPEGLRAAAARHLVSDIERRGWHLSTGFAGTAHLLPVLTQAGYGEVAYRLLHCDTLPSWGFMLRHGATTLWERWDSYTPEHGFYGPQAPPSFIHPVIGPNFRCNSFNHYAFGAVGEWLMRFVAGIDVDPQQPGYEHILIRPRPGGGLTYARGTYESIRGLVASEWSLEGGRLHLQVCIPANTSATVYLPGGRSDSITEGGRPLAQAAGIRRVVWGQEGAIVEIGSGCYRFVAPAHEARP